MTAKSDYGIDDVAAAYRPHDGNFVLINAESRVLEKESLTMDEAAAALQALVDSGTLVRFANWQLALNPDHLDVLKIIENNSGDADRDKAMFQLSFLGPSYNPLTYIEEGPEKLRELMEAFVEKNPSYILVPGADTAVNIRIVDKVAMIDHDCLAFYDYNGDPLVTSIPVAKKKAREIISRVDEYKKLIRRDENRARTKKKSFLEAYGKDLVALAKAGKLDPVIGRDHEIARTAVILNRRTKCNPLLLGETGVGKTAVVEGLALQIAEGNAPSNLKDKTIVALDLPALVAGTKYRGEFEDRLKAVLKEAESRTDLVLFIDEIHTLVGLGATAGSMDAGNILKPALARGTIKCIGATTVREHRKYFKRDNALDRRFQPVPVDELDAVETRKALGDLVLEKYGPHYGILVPEDVLDAAVAFCADLDGSSLIDRSIDVIDEALSTADLDGRDYLTVEDLKAVIALKTKMPEAMIGRDDEAIIDDLEKGFERAIIAQPEAKKALIDAIRRSRAGLHDPQKPLGSFVFLGPSGVGKTALAKALAILTGANFVPLDMSEYEERHSISRLIGAPPGYVGYDQEGKLTGAVTRRPHSVVFMDELPRAHPDIQNVLLQILDEGRLTDGQGNVTRFGRSFVIAAGNVDMKEKGIGFGGKDVVKKFAGSKKGLPKGVKGFFDPAVLGRFDAVIAFDELMLKEVEQIADQFLRQREQWVEAQKRIKVSINASDPAKTYLAALGYSAETGARELNSAIQAKVDDELARAIVSGPLKKGGSVDIGLEQGAEGSEDTLTFKFTAAVQEDTKPVPDYTAVSGKQMAANVAVVKKILRQGFRPNLTPVD